MFLNKKEDKIMSFRDRFIKELNQEIQKTNFERNEKELRKILIEKLKKGQLF